MRKFTILLALLAITLLAPKFLSAQLITGQNAYTINSDIKQCPEFMILLYLDMSYVNGMKISKMTWDVEYMSEDMPSCNGNLPFDFYASGSRYPNSSYAAGDSFCSSYPPLEARQKWWTFENDVVILPSHVIKNITYLVGKGDPIAYYSKFNFCQLYFRFTRSGAYNTGDVIKIRIKNIHVYFYGQSNFNVYQDFITETVVNVGNRTAVADLILKPMETYPNPADNYLNVTDETAVSARLIDMNGFPVKSFSREDLQNKLFIGDVNAGNYLLEIITPSGLCTNKIIISR